jgi:hypothetical protein
VPYDRGVDNDAAGVSTAPAGLDETDNLRILEPLLVALIRTVDYWTEGPIGNVRAGRTIIAEESICARTVEALPEYIIEAWGQSGRKEDGLNINILEAAKLSKLRTKGIACIKD